MLCFGVREHIKLQGFVYTKRRNIDDNKVQIAIRGAFKELLGNVESVPVRETLCLDLECTPVWDTTEHIHFPGVAEGECHVVSAA
jgi:hypothetical protein